MKLFKISLIFALSLINIGTASSMQLPAVQLESETSDSIGKVLITSSICNYLKKPLNNNATKAINDIKAILELHPAAADDVELNEMIIKKLADALKFSPEFNTTCGYEGRDSAIKALIALRLATRGAHLWLGHNSRNLISSVMQNWEAHLDTQIDSSLVLQYAQTLKKSQYADQFQNDLRLYFDFISTDFKRFQISPDEIKLLAKMDNNINECKYRVLNTTLNALMLTVLSRNIELVKAMIEAGADLNVQNNFGDTALRMSLIRDDADPSRARLLLDHGANMNLHNICHATVFDLPEVGHKFKELLYHYAIKKGKANIVKKLQNRELGK